jgi:hypothetical protein
MADNVAITAGSGTNVAADDIASVFYQRVKLSLGADGTAVDAVAGAGATGTGVQRVVEATGACTTGTASAVNDTATDTTILAANTARYGATIWNDSTSILYLLLANATASATNATVKLAAGDYYEVPFGYTGIIKGIWSSDASGAARVTELT